MGREIWPGVGSILGRTDGRTSLGAWHVTCEDRCIFHLRLFMSWKSLRLLFRRNKRLEGSISSTETVHVPGE
jgi:hypothetical protein